MEFKICKNVQPLKKNGKCCLEKHSKGFRGGNAAVQGQLLPRKADGTKSVRGEDVTEPQRLAKAPGAAIPTFQVLGNPSAAPGKTPNPLQSIHSFFFKPL